MTEVRLRDGEFFADAVAALDGYDVGALTIMHTDVDMIDDCLDVVIDAWPGIVRGVSAPWRLRGRRLGPRQRHYSSRLPGRVPSDGSTEGSASEADAAASGQTTSVRSNR